MNTLATIEPFIAGDDERDGDGERHRQVQLVARDRDAP